MISKEGSKEKKSVLMLKVNEELYNQFKYLCSEDGYTMTGAINAFIRRSVKKQEI